MPVDQAAVQKAILKEIDAFCEEHGLRYNLIYGTLIGAVRHKDLIPWDDDIDIMMPRPDYERFCALWKRDKGNSHLKLFLPIENEGYPNAIARVSDSRYPVTVENETPYGLGLFVDIYPFDGLGNTAFGALARGLVGDVASSLCFQSSRMRFPANMFGSPVAKAIGLCAYGVSKAIGTKRILRFIEHMPAPDYNRSKYVGCLKWLSGLSKDIFPRAWFQQQIRLPLGDQSYWAPASYDNVLRKTYGDYMQLPPAEERTGHHSYTLTD